LKSKSLLNHRTTFVLEKYMRVVKVEVAPHASTLMPRHRHDCVFATLGDAHVSNEVEGKPSLALKLSDGETRFVAGNFAPVAKHLSDQLFRNATIELTQDERLRQTPSDWPEMERACPKSTSNQARSYPATMTRVRICWPP
jgi:hypothetical protein